VGIQGAYHRYGLELFSYSYAEDPELVSKFIDTSSRYNLNKILPALEAEFCPLFELGSDVAFKNGLLFPPPFLRKHYIPYLERAAAALHQKGIKAYVHSDGDLNQIIDDIVASGVDGLHPIDPSAGMSIPEVRKKFPKLFILGGIDGRNMAFGTPEMVKKEVQQAIEAAGPNFFVGVSGNIYEDVPVDNVKAMLEVVRGE
jgi:uroporphyrinogen decarboxylase